MTTNKAMILAHVGTTLNTIDGPLGSPAYRQTVATVIDELRNYDQFGALQVPALCYFAAKGGHPPPRYELHNNPEKSFDFIVQGIVGGTTQALRCTALGELEEDVRRALMRDPTRGGWAVDTIQVEDTIDDTGVPNKDGINGNRATAEWRFRCSYFPNDS